MTTPLSALYTSGKIHLWVEDELTKNYLRALWRDADIEFHIAGGHTVVRGAVHDAREQGMNSVFGFRDRDFDDSNHDNWLVPTKNPPVFIPETFEVECYFLDATVLASLTKSLNRYRRKQQEIETALTTYAGQSIWWMAVRATLAQLRRDLTDGFPTHPPLTHPPTLNSKQRAEAYLDEKVFHSAWAQNIPNISALSSQKLKEKLAAQYQKLNATVEDHTWTRFWSGKEVVKGIKNFIGFQDINDLAKAVGAWQRQNQAEPTELFELRQAIRKRAKVDPW